MPLVEPGRKAPAFSLPDQDGKACTTYLIGTDGIVARRGDDGKVDGHAALVLRAVDEL
jgi:peroxiredoxin